MNSFRRGIAGTMPGSDLPWAFVALWRALENGDEQAARRIHAPIAVLVSMLHNLDAFLAVEKTLLVKQGIFRNTLVRGPVGFVSDPPFEQELLRLFDWIKRECET